MRTQKSESRMLNEIENRFLTPDEKQSGKRLLIGYGNYSRSSQMPGFMSTPGLGIRKLLARRFEILIVDEFHTSKFSSRTGEELCKMRINKNGQSQSVYEILTLKRNPNRGIYVNRDQNASENMLKILEQHLMDQTRPWWLSRQSNSPSSNVKPNIVLRLKPKKKICLKPKHDGLVTP